MTTLHEQALQRIVDAIPDQPYWTDLRTSIINDTVQVHSDPVSWIASCGITAIETLLGEREKEDIVSASTHDTKALQVMRELAFRERDHLRNQIRRCQDAIAEDWSGNWWEEELTGYETRLAILATEIIATL